MKKRWITLISAVSGAVTTGLIELLHHIDISALIIKIISTTIGG